jgi:hypothetical protein
MNHPKTKFDIHHMDMLNVRETAIIGKNFPNVWLNLWWSYITSPKIACSAFDEWLDLVPVRKIIGVGGNYHLQAEKVYGHLFMARINITRILGRRIYDNLISKDEALDIAKKLFYPKNFF